MIGKCCPAAPTLCERWLPLWPAAVACALSFGCGGQEAPEGASEYSSDWSDLPPVVHHEPELANLPHREEQYMNLCTQPRNDAFFRAVCTSPRPLISGMTSLIQLAGLDASGGFALTGNSTSLVMASVSPVNPRAIIFPRVTEARDRPDELTILGFVRGDPFVEVVSRDTLTGDYNFYLLAFERPCDYEQGCDLASRVTQEIEQGWTAYSIFTEQQLQNTSLDCLSCHQPGGFQTPKILRMQELQSPWLHWFPQRFVQRTPSDRELTPLFLEAHAVDTAYAGILISAIQNAIDEGSAAQLEALLVAEAQQDQPNVFDPRIEEQAREGAISPIWEELFTASLAGDAISVPYPRADVTDAVQRSAWVRSYVDVVIGAAPRESLLDPRDVLSSDARLKLGMTPLPDADGSTILLQACSRCHDGRADPSISKAAFNVRALEQMNRAMKDKAIARMQLPVDDPLRMPPPRTGDLPPEAIDKAVQTLRQ
jgi:hypothetical protein